MNCGTLMMFGMFGVSMAMLSYLMYKMSVDSLEATSIRIENCGRSPSENSTIEDDFRDILNCINLQETEEIFLDYLMHDKQIANTYSFINDQMKFMKSEIMAIPHTPIIFQYLREIGLRLDYWEPVIAKYWQNLPRYKGNNSGIIYGGFTTMIQKMVSRLPKEDLHRLLRSKARTSTSFQNFLLLINSSLLSDLCMKIGQNDVLNRHYYWAVEANLEVIFAVELFHQLRRYFAFGLDWG